MEVVKHSVKYPFRLKSIAGLFILVSIATRSLFHMPDRTVGFLLFSIALLAFVVLTLYLLYRGIHYRGELRLNSDAIVLYGHSIPTEEIEAILRMGYVRPILGLKSHRAAIIPMRRCFRFAKEEEKSMDDLLQWAESNQVKVVDRFFIRWI